MFSQTRRNLIVAGAAAALRAQAAGSKLAADQILDEQSAARRKIEDLEPEYRACLARAQDLFELADQLEKLGKEVE